MSKSLLETVLGEVTELVKDLAKGEPKSSVSKTYPYKEGDAIVIGPEAILHKDGSVLCYQGVNYYRSNVSVIAEKARLQRVKTVIGGLKEIIAQLETMS